jgi:signal transduction histidine kinase
MLARSTQFQPYRRVILRLAASTESPSDGDGDAQWFAPRLSAEPKRVQKAAPDTLTGDDVYLRFSVEDTGCGLNDEQMQRLFTRFTQASPKTHVQYGVSNIF